MVVGESDSICPFLRWSDNRYLCQLILTESLNGLEPILKTVLGVGLGCTVDAAK